MCPPYLALLTGLTNRPPDPLFFYLRSGNISNLQGPASTAFYRQSDASHDYARELKSQYMNTSWQHDVPKGAKAEIHSPRCCQRNGRELFGFRSGDRIHSVVLPAICEDRVRNHCFAAEVLTF